VYKVKEKYMLKHEYYVKKTKWDKIKKGIKEFFSAILIALVIRVFLIEPYRIPTPSMYPTILEGDMLMANKFWYGVLVPIVNLKLPSFSSPTNGDIILFETPTYNTPGKFREIINFVTFGIFGLDNTRDNPKYFIKRVIGKPGDFLTILDPRANSFSYQLILNEKPCELKPLPDSKVPEFDEKSDYNFFLETIGEKTHYVQYLKRYYSSPNIYIPRELQGKFYIPKNGDYIEFTVIESYDNISDVKKAYKDGLILDINPATRIQVKVGETTLKINGRIMRSLYYTGIKNSILNNEQLYKLLSEGKVSVKVNDDFYFVVGDNRDNSLDSRYWGFVPKNLIMGNPLFRHFPISRIGKVDKINVK